MKLAKMGLMALGITLLVLACPMSVIAWGGIDTMGDYSGVYIVVGMVVLGVLAIIGGVAIKKRWGVGEYSAPSQFSQSSSKPVTPATDKTVAGSYSAPKPEQIPEPQVNFPLLEGEQILHQGEAYYRGMGQLYFTNKRLYFEASQTDNSSIMLDEIKYINETDDKSGFVATLKNDNYEIFITPSDRKWTKIILNFAPKLQEPPAVPKPEVPQQEAAYLLGHYLHETDRSNLQIGNATSTSWKEHYYTQSLPLRPINGVLKTTITCNTCNEELTLKMVSKATLKAQHVVGFIALLVVLGLLSIPVPLLAPVPIGLLLGFIFSRLFPKAYKNYDFFEFDRIKAFDGITLTPKGKSKHTHKLLI